MITALLINPYLEKTQIVRVLPKFRAYYTTMSNPGNVVDIIQPVAIGDQAKMYVDEHGFLKNDVPVFKLGPYQFAGKALIAGGSVDEDDRDVPTPVVVYLRGLLQWTNLLTTGEFAEPETPPELPPGYDFAINIAGPPILKEAR